MIIEKVFEPDFFVHSLSYDNTRTANKNTSFSSILQLDGKIEQERIISNSDSKTIANNKESPLPSLNYLVSNPLVTGKFNETNKEALSGEISESSAGLLPKFLIITHKLNPISVGDFIGSLSTCIKRMYDVQREEFHNLKRNLPHHHVINGFTIEGVMALMEENATQVFVPFAANRAHFYEDMFSKLVDGSSETTSDDLLSTQVVAWLNNVMLPYFTDSQTGKYHFFAYIQSHGHASTLKSDTSSAFDRNQSPLEKLNLELGFHRASKL